MQAYNAAYLHVSQRLPHNYAYVLNNRVIVAAMDLADAESARRRQQRRAEAAQAARRAGGAVAEATEDAGDDATARAAYGTRRRNVLRVFVKSPLREVMRAQRIEDSLPESPKGGDGSDGDGTGGNGGSGGNEGGSSGSGGGTTYH